MTKKNHSLPAEKSHKNQRTTKAKKATNKNCSDHSQYGRNKIGRWENWEHEAFLRGLKVHGKGNWKLISSLIPTRTTVQVKTHAQMYFKTRKWSEESTESTESIVESYMDELTVSTKGSSESNQSMTVPIVITIEKNAAMTMHHTPRCKNAAYILAHMNDTFVHRNERKKAAEQYQA